MHQTYFEVLEKTICFELSKYSLSAYSVTGTGDILVTGASGNATSQQ